MDVTQLKKDRAAILSKITVTKTSVVAKEPTTIMVPEIYERKGLLDVAEDTFVIGIYAIIIGDRYCLSLTPAMMQTEPTRTRRIKIDDEPYVCLDYEPGALITVNRNLVKSVAIIYAIADALIVSGHMPWYFDYESSGKLLNGARRFTGSHINDRRESYELLMSILARNPTNPIEQYRHYLKDLGGKPAEPPYYSPLRSVQFLAADTTAKLTGSFFSEGRDSALLNPSEKSDRIESYLLA